MTDLPERDDDEEGGPGAAGSRLQRWRAGVVGGYSPDTVQPDPGTQRRSLVVLAGVVALVVAGAAAGHFLAVVVTVALIAAVIMLHELGHFIAAKLGGMKVTEYFLGFGPRLWSVRKGETTYGIKAIPAGGYVRIIGMNNVEKVDPADEARTYRQATFPRRFAVGVAGSTVHFILALITAWALFAFAGQSKLIPGIAVLTSTPGQVTPAQAAGFRPGDRFVSYDGHPVESWGPLHSYIQSHIGKSVTFVVRRGGADVTLHATPGDESTYVDPSGAPFTTEHVGFLGIEPMTGNYSLLGSVPHAARSFWDVGVVGTFQGLGAIFSPTGLSDIGHQVVSAPGAASPATAGNRPISIIGIVQIAGQLHGWADKAMLFFEANAFVGVVNLLPVLPFDGGHVVIAIYEAVRSRRGRRYRADANKMVPYAMAVMVLLAFVFMSSVYLDVAHPISLH